MTANSNEETLGFLIADVYRQLRRSLARQSTATSLTFAESRSLIYVARNEGIRQIDLAEILDIQPITLTRLIDRLEANGLVERRSSSEDRRTYKLYLLPAAKKHLVSISKLTGKVRMQMTSGIKADDLEITLKTLRAMRNNLDPP